MSVDASTVGGIAEFARRLQHRLDRAREHRSPVLALPLEDVETMLAIVRAFVDVHTAARATRRPR